jgi:hypothetical protein
MGLGLGKGWARERMVEMGRGRGKCELIGERLGKTTEGRVGIKEVEFGVG